MKASKKLTYLIFFILISKICFGYQFTIQGFVKDTLSHSPFYRQKINIYDKTGIYNQSIIYTDVNGFYSISYNINSELPLIFVIQTHGFCENYWIPYTREKESFEGTTNIDFNICHNYSGLEQIFKIKGSVRQSENNSILANYKVTISENYAPKNQIDLLTDASGNYEYTYHLPPDYNVDFMISTNGNCNNQWTIYSDTIENFSGTYTKNFKICHNPQWYLVDFNVSGFVFDEITNQAVANHQIYFTKDNNFLQTQSATTDVNGYYSKAINVNLLDSSVLSIKTYSICQNNWIEYSDTVNVGFEPYQKDFYICGFKENENQCFTKFIYHVNNQDLQVDFNEISLSPIKNINWTLGDTNTNTTTFFTHQYKDAGKYKVCLNNTYLDNCDATYCEEIEVGNKFNISGQVYAGNNLLPKGNAILYKYLNNNYLYQNITEIKNGNFEFENIFQANYSIYAIPIFEIDTIYFPKYFPTYNYNNLNWSENKNLNINSNINNINISLNKYNVLYYGKSAISGEFFFNSGNKTVNKEITVLLYNSQNQVIAFSSLDDNNKYYFENLPLGNYKIYPENAGRTSTPALINLNSNISQLSNLDFKVSNTIIEYIENASKNININSLAKIYPNPFYDILNININDSNIKNFKVEIFDLFGKKVFTNNFNFSENQIINLNLAYLTKGMYFIKIYEDKKNILNEKIIKSF